MSPGALNEAPLPTPPKDAPPAPKNPLAAEEIAKTELGCMLGAFRDVANSIGMQVMAVTLRMGKKPPQDRADSRAAGPPALPKGRSRRDKKLIALVQTFADNVLAVGYILVKVDMKEVPPGRPGERKLWKMRVDIESAA